MAALTGMYTYYTTADCSGAPSFTYSEADSSCGGSSDVNCSATTVGASDAWYSYTCTDDSDSVLLDVFGSQDLIGYTYYDDVKCVNDDYTLAFAATGDCVVVDVNMSVVARVFEDGEGLIDTYTDSENCSSLYYNEATAQTDSIEKKACLTFGSTQGYVIFTTASLSSSPGLGAGAIAAIIAGAVIAVAIIVIGVVLWLRRRRKRKSPTDHEAQLGVSAKKLTVSSDGSLQTATSSQASTTTIIRYASL